MNEKIKKVNLDTSGYDAFIKLCSTEQVSKENIEKLLETSSYQKAIKIMGAHWGVPEEKQWLEYFSYAFDCKDGYLNAESLTSTQRQYAEYIKQVKKDVTSLIETKNKIVEAVKSREFILLASQYLPDNVFEDELDVLLLVFGPNAGGNECIMIDVPFFNTHPKDSVTRILAHELHHFLRNKIEKTYTIKEDFSGIHQALFWFETEGIANLCNFKETSQLYSDYGYVKPDVINSILLNMKEHIKELNDILMNNLQGNIGSDKVLQYLRKDFLFHPMSYFLANTICSTFGNKAIGQVAGDPLTFINMYQNACKSNEKNKPYAFSDDMLKLLQSAYE